MSDLLKGKLHAWAETGTEGFLWCFEWTTNPNPVKDGRENLRVLEDVDFIRIYENVWSDKVLWEGVVKLDWKKDYQPYPMNPSCGQQCVLGCWVHGLQEGMDSEAWAGMFFRQLKAEYRAKD